MGMSSPPLRQKLQARREPRRAARRDRMRLLRPLLGGSHREARRGGGGERQDAYRAAVPRSPPAGGPKPLARVRLASGFVTWAPPPATLDGAEPVMSPIPEVGEHNEKLLAELGYGETRGMGSSGGYSRSLESQSKGPSKRLPS